MFGPAHPLQKILGLIIWSLYFVFLYAGVSVACNQFPPTAEKGSLTWVNMGLFAITLLVAVSLFYLAWRGWKALNREKQRRIVADEPRNRPLPPHEFILTISVAVYIMAGVATLATGLPALVLTPCL